MNNTQAVVIVGAGGIGSCLFQDLCRFLPRQIHIHLFDGDQVEGKNVARQHFGKRDEGRNKAEALAEKASNALGLNNVYYLPQYLTKPGQLRRLEDQYPYGGIILVGCVDNHPARRVMEQFVRSARRPVYYIDCANEERAGEVVAVVNLKGQLTGAFRSEWDPRVLTDDKGDPTKASCGVKLDAGNIQTLFTNRKAAIIALELIGTYFEGNARTGIVYFKKCVTERLREVTNDEGSEEMVPGERPASPGGAGRPDPALPVQ